MPAVWPPRANEFAATTTRNPPSWIGLPGCSRGRVARPSSIEGHPVIQRPRRAGVAPHTVPRGPKDLAGVTSQPGRGSGHQCRGLRCRGALTRPRLCSSTLSHKQRGRGGTLQGRMRVDGFGAHPRRPPSPALPPQTARGKGASVGRHRSCRGVTSCHPEARARRTGPRTVPRGPKDLACVTSERGRGSGTEAGQRYVPRLDWRASRGVWRIPRSLQSAGVRSGTPWPLRRDDTAAGGAPHCGRVHPRQGSPRRRTSCGRCSEFIRPCRARAPSMPRAPAPLVPALAAAVGMHGSRPAVCAEAGLARHA
jgi:hypothetical protein